MHEHVWKIKLLSFSRFCVPQKYSDSRSKWHLCVLLSKNIGVVDEKFKTMRTLDICKNLIL